MNRSTRATSVLVANLSAPELGHLGAELERRKVLRHYVRPYVNKQRWWEKTLERAPVVGRQLRRRTAPPCLPLSKVTGAGIMQDLVAAAVGQLPVAHAWRRRVSHELIFAAERAVARQAGVLASGVDIVVASYGTARYAFEAARRTGGCSVLNYPIAHNDYQARLYREEAARSPEFAAALPRLDQLPRDYSERLNIESELADCILVGSSFARHSFVDLGYDPGKVVVVPYGVDTQRFVPRSEAREDGRFRVLFAGQIGERKGVSYLLKAYQQFRRHDCELHLVGGYGPGREVYAPYNDLYRHTAHVPQQELPAVLQQADVLVLPSLVEGMGLVVLEAMACGVPVIVTTHGPGDIVRDGIDGFFVPIRDSNAIAMRLEQLYREPELRRQMGIEARLQALRFGWSAYARTAADVVLGIRQPDARAFSRAAHNG